MIAASHQNKVNTSPARPFVFFDDRHLTPGRRVAGAVLFAGFLITVAASFVIPIYL